MKTRDADAAHGHMEGMSQSAATSPDTAGAGIQSGTKLLSHYL